MRALIAILLLLTLSTGALEASQPESSKNLLFILDASGSMWGRIDGTPKISVAKEVMAGLVADLPDDAKAGLTAYGHGARAAAAISSRWWAWAHWTAMR